jgi:hypothetical protein
MSEMPSPIYSKTLLDFHREMLCSHIGLIIEYKNNGSELYSSTMLCYEKRGVLRAPAGENGRHPTAAPLVTDKYGNPECTLFRMCQTRPARNVGEREGIPCRSVKAELSATNVSFNT